MDSPPPIECACGSQNFERVVVKRPNGTPYPTEFIACAECRVMYYSPEARDPPTQWVSVMPEFVPGKRP